MAAIAVADEAFGSHAWQGLMGASRGNNIDTLKADTRAPQLLVGKTVSIGSDVQIGANVVIHDNTVIEDGVTIQDGAILGKIAYRRRDSSIPAVDSLAAVIGANSTICTRATVFAGASIGVGCFLGDNSALAERVVLADGAVVGRDCGIGFGVVIGEGAILQTGVLLDPGTVVEEHAFLGPRVMTLGDDSMLRHDREEPWPIVLRRACRIGGGVMITASVEIGEEAFVAAGALVTKSVAARAKVMGAPARVYGEVAEHELVGRWR